jgi:hypothetical protein
LGSTLKETKENFMKLKTCEYAGHESSKEVYRMFFGHDVKIKK